MRGNMGLWGYEVMGLWGYGVVFFWTPKNYIQIPTCRSGCVANKNVMCEPCVR